MGSAVKASAEASGAEMLRMLKARNDGPAYHRIKLHGEKAALLWGYHEAATFRSWRIWKGSKGWQLAGTVARLDAFQARQTPLLFSAPRERGFWMWGVESIEVKGAEVRAYLGEPEQ